MVLTGGAVPFGRSGLLTECQAPPYRQRADPIAALLEGRQLQANRTRLPRINLTISATNRRRDYLRLRRRASCCASVSRTKACDLTTLTGDLDALTVSPQQRAPDHRIQAPRRSTASGMLAIGPCDGDSSSGSSGRPDAGCAPQARKKSPLDSPWAENYNA